MQQSDYHECNDPWLSVGLVLTPEHASNNWEWMWADIVLTTTNAAQFFCHCKQCGGR